MLKEAAASQMINVSYRIRSNALFNFGTIHEPRLDVFFYTRAIYRLFYSEEDTKNNTFWIKTNLNWKVNNEKSAVNATHAAPFKVTHAAPKLNVVQNCDIYVIFVFIFAKIHIISKSIINTTTATQI